MNKRIYFIHNQIWLSEIKYININLLEVSNQQSDMLDYIKKSEYYQFIWLRQMFFSVLPIYSALIK